MAELWHLTAYFTCLLLIDTALASTSSEQLAEGYLDSSDDYPNGWQLDPRQKLKCGEHVSDVIRSSRGKNRIYNGKIAYPGQFPYTVRIELVTELGDKKICGGTIIGLRWVITAASCFQNEQFIRWRAWNVIAGDHSMQQTLDGEKRIQIAEVQLHNDYKPYTNDIAMVKTHEYIIPDLKEKLGGYGAINTACVPSTDYTNDEPTWLVAGWGGKENGEVPDLLSYYKPKLVQNSRCTGYYDPRAVFDPEAMICIFNQGRESIGDGDFGNGVVRILPDGRYELVGIVSYGHPTRPDAQPVVLTNVYHYLEWINNLLDSDQEEKNFQNWLKDLVVH